MLWRIVLEGKATLKELEEYYSFQDLLDFHEALDIRDALEEEAINAANAKTG